MSSLRGEWEESGRLFDQLRCNNYSYHLYTYGKDLYKFVLIDFTISPSPLEDNVVWENEVELPLLTIARQVVSFAREQRDNWGNE